MVSIQIWLYARLTDTLTHNDFSIIIMDTNWISEYLDELFFFFAFLINIYNSRDMFHDKPSSFRWHFSHFQDALLIIIIMKNFHNNSSIDGLHSKFVEQQNWNIHESYKHIIEMAFMILFVVIMIII